MQMFSLDLLMFMFMILNLMVWIQLETGCRVLMCITFTQHTGMGKEISGSYLLLGLDLPCCLAQSSDLQLINSKLSTLSLSLSQPSIFHIFKVCLLLKLQGQKEGMCDILHYLHTELHDQAFSSIQGFAVGSYLGWCCYFSPVFFV